MSFKASAWAVEQKVGNSTAKILLLTLAEAASIEDASCFPSRATLADRIEASVDTVDRALRFLEQAGFITITRRQRPNRSDSSNVYTINLNREPQNAASRTAMRPPQPQGYAAPPSRTAMRPQVTGQSEPSKEQVNSCRVGNSTQINPAVPVDSDPTGNSPANGNAEGRECFNLEANPAAEPTGQGRETPPVPLPPLTDKYADARKVLAHLNATTSSHYRETPGNLALIHGRLLEVTGDVGGVLQMIDRMVAKWGQDPKMVDYLCPATLFRKSNFGGYYDNRDKPVISVQPKAAQKPSRPIWAIRKELKERLEAVKAKLMFHGGYSRSGTYVPEKTTPALIADAEKLVKERDELQSKLAALPPEDE